MIMEVSSATDIGLLREKNQDSCIALRNGSGDLLALVCDGIGGSNAGEIASAKAISYFEREFPKTGPFKSLKDAKDQLDRMVKMANSYVFELSKSDYHYRGMGTTLTGILITSFGNLSINLGDSRVYGFVDGKCFHLTSDHTLVNRMLENGEITYEESLNHPKRHYLLRALGVCGYAETDIHKVKDMDYYLVCSDGLHGYVEEKQILSIVTDESLSVERKTKELVNLALLKGGYDNITVVLIRK